MQSKRKRSLLVPFCVLAIAGAAVLIGWFVHMMALQTSWKNDRLRLAGYFSVAEHYGAAISCGETTIEANEQILDYYYTFLTFPRSMAVRRAADAELSDAITLKLPKTTLYLTEAPDGVSTCVLFLRAFTLKNRIPRKTAAPQALQAFPVHTKGRAVARTERIFRHAQLSLSACQLGAVAFRQQPPLFREGAYCLRLRAGQNVQHDPFSAEIDGRDADHSAVPICRPIHAQLLTGSSLLPPEAAVKANAPSRGFAMFSLRHLCTFFQFSV